MTPGDSRPDTVTDRRPAAVPHRPATGSAPTRAARQWTAADTSYPWVVQARGLRRRYGTVTALDDVDLAVRPGEFVGMLGPNGAGKTTLLNLVLGLRRPDAGWVRLFGGSPLDPRRRIRVGVTPQETALPETLRVHEVVAWVGGHFPDPAPWGELLDRFGLLAQARRQTGGLSGGQRRRLSLALAFAGRPDLLVLDEPTTGLDVEARADLWACLREAHDGGTTLLLTSHYLEEIEALAERVVVLDDGRLLADDALDAVLARVGSHLVTRRSPDPAALDRLPGLVGRRSDGDKHELTVRDSDLAVTALVSAGVPFTGLTVRGASLEEALLTMRGASSTSELHLSRGIS